MIAITHAAAAWRALDAHRERIKNLHCDTYLLAIPRKLSVYCTSLI
jgi:hypothetical protein